jgi:hypothetical protein
MNIKEKAEKIFLQVYEWENEVKLNGVLPEKNDSEQYKWAKIVSLRYTLIYDLLDEHFYITQNL